MRAAAPLRPGRELAPGHCVLAHLSRGDALDVYEVFSEERLCSAVAKTPRPDRRDDARVRERLLREGELLQRLAHPHLVRAFATYPDPPVVVVETRPGPTVEQLVDEGARLYASDLVHLGAQLVSALHYLHGSGWLHLDVRPGNVLVSGGTATLVDLSLARPPGRVPRGLGTREYLSPEQASGGRAGPPADVWGLGATLFEAATGVPPFAPEGTQEDRLVADGGYLQLVRAAPPLTRWRRRLPGELRSLVAACLAPDPADRPATAELSAVLRRLEEPGEVSRP